MTKMTKMKKEALDVIFEINKNNFEMGGKYDKDNIDRINSNIIVELCKSMCELQKQECYEEVDITTQSKCEINIYGCSYPEIDKDSILNCKNVCDE